MAVSSRPWSAITVKPSCLLLPSERKPSDGSLFLKAARLLGANTGFEASKLKVFFLGGLGKEKAVHPEFAPRTYTLTHCDLTANLTLSVSRTVNRKQLRGWYKKLQRDDVVAEWKKFRDEMSLHVHCHVSGGHLLLDLAAELRYHIFRKELPLVLQAVIHGDSTLFSKHPELVDSLVWVYFHSNSKEFNRIECWGPLKDAAMAQPT
ncbi:protein STAY-GREEN, chloroplastic-like [Nymphaea colorata]|nr:protein STAY-GREEN, chloroplastic-like [Nymphaea colorata]